MESRDSPLLDEVYTAAFRLGQHPQDHGWRELYRLFAHGIRMSSPEVVRLIVAFRSHRPTNSCSHLITLLGIAVKSAAPAALDRLVSDEHVDTRLGLLEEILNQNSREMLGTLFRRQNSFTGARRFVLPQVLLSSYFGQLRVACNFADLGTGLGILPRQLNSRALFESLGGELEWPDGNPPFRAIPLNLRFGVDRGPLPDLAWVRTCYGSSRYYDQLYDELVATLRAADFGEDDVRYRELDVLDADALARFVTENDINAVNLCYVLYQFEPGRRRQVVDTLRASLAPPGLIIVTEPRGGDVTQPGCTVSMWDRANQDVRTLCGVSDGHFRGSVTPLDDFAWFNGRYPLDVEPCLEVGGIR